MDTFIGIILGSSIFLYNLYTNHIVKFLSDSFIASAIPLTFVGYGQLEDTMLKITLYITTCFVCGSLLIWRHKEHLKD